MTPGVTTAGPTAAPDHRNWTLLLQRRTGSYARDVRVIRPTQLAGINSHLTAMGNMKPFTAHNSS